MSDVQITFQIDQKIVYPSQGVGKITEITEREFKGQMTKYYTIYLEVSDMIVMVPVNRVEELGIRAIVEPDEALKAIEMIGEDFEPITSDWKLRYQMNLDLLKKGSVSDIATIVRCLYHRSKVKELPILERKLYDSAKKLLEDEISFSLGKTAREVESLIHAKLEPLGGLRDSKHSTDEFEEDEDEDFIEEDNTLVESEEEEEDEEEMDDEE